jgi:hypothetical protein
MGNRETSKRRSQDRVPRYALLFRWVLSPCRFLENTAKTTAEVHMMTVLCNFNLAKQKNS